eukprot:6038724-Pleurochrysis_carterae.AAC.1
MLSCDRRQLSEDACVRESSARAQDSTGRTEKLVRLRGMITDRTMPQIPRGVCRVSQHARVEDRGTTHARVRLYAIRADRKAAF